MNQLSTWFKTNRLFLNVSKTNCMIFGRSNQPDHHRVYIDNIVIERVNCNKSMVLMYKIYNNLMPSDILSYCCMVHMSHDHDTRQAGHFKNMYCRTTLKSKKSCYVEQTPQ